VVPAAACAVVTKAVSDMTDEERDALDDAYYKQFKTFPPIVYWHRTWAELQELMVMAMERGTPLTAEDLANAQGIDLPPPEAKT
jgi:hypothetical protein